LGAAYLAGLAVGYWHGLDDVQGQWQLDRRFQPDMSPAKVAHLVNGWHRAVKAAIAWADAE
ncbi:MAG: glycerol kinase, partial [Paludibacterium sp.]|nr:glycerol kinase [Paludibacterium sp.]